MVMVPHSLDQSGLFGKPEKPREVSEQAFNSPNYKERHLVGAAALITLAALSIMPGHLLYRKKAVFWVVVAGTTLPFIILVTTVLRARDGMGADGDTATHFSAIAALAVWSLATLSLPASLVLSQVVVAMKEIRGPNNRAHRTAEC